MNAFTVQITYRRGKPLAAYIYMPSRGERRSVRTEEVRPNLLIDYAEDGTVLGIEVLSLKLSSEDIYAAFDHVGLNRPDPRELRPILDAA
jgi:uncharacterized protein YuzE